MNTPEKMSPVPVGCVCGWKSQRTPNLFGEFGRCKRCGDIVHSMADLKPYKEDHEYSLTKKMCVEHGIDYYLVANRYYKLGWELEDALTAEKYQRKGYLSRSTLYEYKGETAHLAYFTKKYNVSHGAVNGRLKRGWTLAKSIETPVRYKKKNRIKSEINPDITLEVMKELPEGSMVGIACRSCEGHEDHTKQQDGTWKCNWCGDIKDMNTD